MIEKTGRIQIPISRINKTLINYLFSVVKNAKCDQIDVYYTRDTLYIGADSLETHLVSLYRIPLIDVTQNKVQITESTELTEDIAQDDIDDLLEPNEVIIQPGVISFENIPLPPANIIPNPPLPPAPLPSVPLPPAPLPPAPLPPAPLHNTLGAADTLYFCTLTEFLQALLIDDNPNRTIDITVEEREIFVAGGDYRFKYPNVKGYVDLNYYLDTVNNKTWEKINVESAQKVAKAITSTSKDSMASRFVTMEKDRIYSDNSFLLVSALSWKLQYVYNFTYESVYALTKLPVSDKADVMVSKADGSIFLRYGELYLSWTSNNDSTTENILGLVDIDAMVPVLTLTPEMVKKLRHFRNMISSVQVEEDKVITIEMIDNGLAKVTQEGNALLCKVNCLKGVRIEVDIDALLTAVNLCNSKNPIIKAEVTGETDYLVISGGLDVLINVEKVKKV